MVTAGSVNNNPLVDGCCCWCGCGKWAFPVWLFLPATIEEEELANPVWEPNWLIGRPSLVQLNSSGLSPRLTPHSNRVRIPCLKTCSSGWMKASILGGTVCLFDFKYWFRLVGDLMLSDWIDSSCRHHLLTVRINVRPAVKKSTAGWIRISCYTTTCPGSTSTDNPPVFHRMCTAETFSPS